MMWTAHFGLQTSRDVSIFYGTPFLRPFTDQVVPINRSKPGIETSRDVSDLVLEVFANETRGKRSQFNLKLPPVIDSGSVSPPKSQKIE